MEVDKRDTTAGKHNISSQLSNNPVTKDDLAYEVELLSDYDFHANANTTPPTTTTAWSHPRSCLVAIKQYKKHDELEYAMAKREVSALTAISDPAIPALLDQFDPAATVFIITEHRDTESLKSYIEGRGPLGELRLKSVVTQLMSALASIFMAGLAHLRLCDETMSIDSSGQLVIRDFQYAHGYAPGRDVVEEGLYTATQKRYGSDIYVAPEVFAVQRYNARKAVMWSCGVAVVCSLLLFSQGRLGVQS